MATIEWSSDRVSAAGAELRVMRGGKGPPIIVLHRDIGTLDTLPFYDRLADNHLVLIPNHPGYGASPRPDWVRSVRDIAVVYRALVGNLGLQQATLVGLGFGGWIAAEMAVRSTHHFSHLVLTAPLGIKVGGVTERDIADMHAITSADFMRLAWADPQRGAIDYTALPESELAAIVRGREALALFGWKPYMHNPRLKRWLHRIDRPTLLLWGEHDRIVTPTYGEAWRAEIPGARLDVIRDAGHFPHWEQPAEFVRRVAEFGGGN